jgi:hypothetical protein
VSPICGEKNSKFFEKYDSFKELPKKDKQLNFKDLLYLIPIMLALSRMGKKYQMDKIFRIF